MKPQITIEQLRKALNKICNRCDESENITCELKEVYSFISKRLIPEIIDIIDNPEKYKHLWEDWK